MSSLEEAYEYIKKNLKENRFIHTLGVVQEAKNTLDNAIKELAELKRLVNLWGEDFRKQFNREEKI